jgi:hypothetical protein
MGGGQYPIRNRPGCRSLASRRYAQQNARVRAVWPRVYRIQERMVVEQVLGRWDFPREQPRHVDAVTIHVLDQSLVVAPVPENVLM